DRAAATAGDDDVNARDLADRADRAGDVRCRAVALHPCRADDEVRGRVPALEDLDDVANRRAVERRDDADLARPERQRPLSRTIEQPFALEPRLQLIERELQRAESVRLPVLADDLVFP